jgi:hypothetical protein
VEGMGQYNHVYDVVADELEARATATE